MPTSDERVLLQPVLAPTLFNTVATATAPDILELDVGGRIAALGPRLSGITVHTTTRGATTNFRWTILLYQSYFGKLWYPVGTPGGFTLFTAISANGEGPQAPFTNLAAFGLNMRYVLACWQSAAGQQDNAMVGATIQYDLKT